MKIRIYGPCGSGKSYFAKKLSDHMQINLYETDNMIWNRDLNVKYSRDERNQNLHAIMAKESWIIEGAQYKWSFESFEEADIIISIEPNPFKLFKRVNLRFIKMQRCPENYNYQQSFKELLEMHQQNTSYYRTTKVDFHALLKANHLNCLVLKDSNLSDNIKEQILSSLS